MDIFVVFIRSLNVGNKNIVDIDELIKIFLDFLEEDGVEGDELMNIFLDFMR